MDRDSFVGLWEMACFPVSSELLLLANGSYHHWMMGAVQSHWGTWSLQEEPEQTYLVLDLEGAQPVSFAGAMGAIPINWPNHEKWAVVSVQPNQIVVFHGSLTRKDFVKLPAAAAQSAAPPPVSAPSVASAKQAPDLTGDAAQTQSPAAPAGHQAPVMANWKKLDPDALQAWQDSMKAIQGVYTGMQQDIAKTYTAMRDSNKTTFANIYGQRNDVFQRGVGMQQRRLGEFEQVGYAGAQDFISKIIGG